MKLEIKNINASLNKAFLCQSPFVAEIDKFKENYKTLTSSIKPADSEETIKTYINDFLKNTYYQGKFATKVNVNNIDLVILNGKNVDDKIGVIFETKAIKSTEMITAGELNKKSFQELIQYYLEERIINENVEIKHLIITNSIDWFIFDAAEFERLFYQNKSFLKKYNDWYNQKLVSKNKDWFYSEIARPFIENEQESIICTHFQLSDNIEFTERLLIEFYKIFSPEHLLKLPVQNDSNTLNREFYNELLHIIGLSETKDNSRKIQRLKINERLEGSLLENAINSIQTDDIFSSVENPERFGDTEEEQLFSVGLELCITWLNRILFLKLLESQLLNYNQNKQEYSFLNANKIRDFEELRELFFEILAVKTQERKASFQRKYENIPYLNSSLFEQSTLEKEFVKINQLKQHLKLPVYSATVLKDENGKRISGEKSTLQYLFEFLDSYNFASDNKVKIQETNKTIINSSVLGLIFEKINGYKEGSFYTPGFITMYMCSETLRKAIIQKYNSEYNWNCNSIIQLYNQLGNIDIEKANKTFNSIRICDPAVGSGHFLVSALNELIAIKSELGILCDNSGKKLRNTYCEVQNDELFITYDKELFQYDKKDKEKQRIQETIFNEKRILIENCLFGVDINTKSVQICRLRLWIELLKNAYYTQETEYSELETLPNIDINIKCGNSLINRFTLNGEGFTNGVAQKMQQATQKYKDQVIIYKATTDKKIKQQTEKKIAELKETFASIVNPNDKDYIELKKKESELGFAPMTFSHDDAIQWNMKVIRLTKEINELKAKYEEKLKTVYGNSFEWRFEFPEILDENGKFIGFDVIIGNPPYGVKLSNRHKEFYLKNYFFQDYQLDTYLLFIEKVYSLIVNTGYISFIIPNTWLTNLKFKKIRKFVIDKNKIHLIAHYKKSVFKEAVVDTEAFLIQKKEELNENILIRVFETEKESYKLTQNQNVWAKLKGETINLFLTENQLNLFEKIQKDSIQLNELVNLVVGVKPYEVGKGNPEQTYEMLHNRIYDADFKVDETYRKLLRGKDINKYVNLWNGKRWIKYGNNLAAPRKQKTFDAKEKIVIRQTGDKLIAAIDNLQFICMNNLHIITLLPKSKIKLKYLLALLNSKLFDFYHQCLNPEKGEALAEIKKENVGKLPVKIISMKEQNKFVKLVDEVLELKSTNSQSDTKILEDKIDEMVFEIYNLSQKETELCVK
jgi:hypothetical protein